MQEMRNKIRVFLSLMAAAALACGCVKTLNLHDTTMDSEYEPDKVSTYYLWKALQIDDVNVNGIDIKPYFDWFDSFQLLGATKASTKCPLCSVSGTSWTWIVTSISELALGSDGHITDLNSIQENTMAATAARARKIVMNLFFLILSPP